MMLCFHFYYTLNLFLFLYIYTVPGLGPIGVKTLIEQTAKLDHPINSGYALIGMYLTMKHHGVDCKSHQDCFYQWLRKMDLHAQANTVTQAIAEKCSLYFPTLYDRAAYPLDMSKTDKMEVEGKKSTA